MRVIRVLLLALLVVVTACSSADPDPGPDDTGDTTESSDATDDGDAGDTPDDAGADDAADPPEDAAPPAAEAGATVAIGGTTYEATDVVDCKTGEAGFPDDRAFIGASADGQVRIDINWFADESLAGLNGVTVEIEGVGRTGGELVWSTSYAGPDSMTIEPRADGADGTAQLGSLNRPDGETVTDATWSFTC